jgi:hypothetical protein
MCVVLNLLGEAICQSGKAAGSQLNNPAALISTTHSIAIPIQIVVRVTCGIGGSVSEVVAGRDSKRI